MINKKRFIYLISPNKINNSSFYNDLEVLLKSNKIEYFQLRLKNQSSKKIIAAAKKIKNICQKYNVKFIINDKPLIALKVKADGCHLGQGDMNIINARKILKNKIIGVTCNNSKELGKIATQNKANYLAIGAFFNSKTKNTKFKAKMNLIKTFKKTFNLPIVVIGGINQTNYKKLLLHKPDFLAISGFIWNNKKLKPFEALKLLKYES